MQLEFNNAIKDREFDLTHPIRIGLRKCNHDRNQNPRVVPCA